MHNEFNFTGIIVSHDIPEVFNISDHVAMLANGVIIEAGTTEEFIASENPRGAAIHAGRNRRPDHSPIGDIDM